MLYTSYNKRSAAYIHTPDLWKVVSFHCLFLCVGRPPLFVSLSLLQVVIMALTGVVLIVGVVIILNDLVGNPALTDLSDTHFSVMSRRLRTFPFHKLKIPLVVFQVCVPMYPCG